MSHRILIVDDSPAMQGIIERIIHLCGIDVAQILKASNGADALSILKSHAVDLILTDINMPESTGDDLVRHVAGDERLCHIPVIVVSTDSTQNRISQLTRLGAKGYLAKPFSPEQLRAVIEQVLGSVYA